MVETFKPGEVLRVECYDWTGGQIGTPRQRQRHSRCRSDEGALPVRPFKFEGAEPGDLLVVDILDIGALPDLKWGFNGLFAMKTAAAF